MLRPGHLRTLLTQSVIALALLGAAGGAGCTAPEAQSVPAPTPAPVDSQAPEGLWTATFANG